MNTCITCGFSSTREFMNELQSTRRRSATSFSCILLVTVTNLQRKICHREVSFGLSSRWGRQEWSRTSVAVQRLILAKQFGFLFPNLRTSNNLGIIVANTSSCRRGNSGKQLPYFSRGTKHSRHLLCRYLIYGTFYYTLPPYMARSPKN